MTPLRQRMIDDLRIRGLSQHTIDSYVGAVARFARHFNTPPQYLTREHVRAFQVYLTTEKHVSTATLNVYTSAIRFLYTVTLERDWNIRTIPYAKAAKKLPDVLSQDEIVRLLCGIANIKHRAMVMALYAAGLRVSEVAGLRIADIDSTRMLIHVRQGKGARDRLVPLAEQLLATLRLYYRSYRPETWLFLGQDKRRPINPRSIHRAVIKASLATIGRRVYPHLLRHTCATHMLEAGVGVRIVQGFLGHQRLSTTGLYVHVTRAQITATKSPLDLIATIS